MKTRERFKQILYILLPVLGLIFTLWYIRAAGANVIYSDYIRIVDSYLDNVGDLSRMFVPDILTRIPASFLQRLVNVRSLAYSVNFDRLCTTAGLLLIALVLNRYANRQEIRPVWYALLMVVLFSLNKWEILLNGTAWAHVVSFGLFFINYYFLDLAWTGESEVWHELLLCLMPYVWLLFAGEYIASYAAVMILISILGMLTGGANSWAGTDHGLFPRILINTLIALGLYMLSRHFAVWEHAGATTMGVFDVIAEDPGFLPRLFVKSFAGAVLGQETIYAFIGGKALPEFVILLIGVLVICLYLFAFYLYFKGEMLEKTVFPLILLLSGVINHVLVCIARWIFLKDSYGLSSRYSAQFMIGILGILLVFALYRDRSRVYSRKQQDRKTRVRALIAAGAVFILAGNCYTTYQEIRKAPYREANYEHMIEVLRDYENYDTEELMRVLEWHKSEDTLYSAINILKDNKLNVFSTMGW